MEIDVGAADVSEARSLLRVIFAARWISAIAVVFAGLGAALMMIVGSVSTIDSIGEYFGAGKEEAFSDEAAINASIMLISSLDQFLLGLVLFIFAYGVYSLFIAPPASESEPSGWFAIGSLTDLKVKLLETIAVLLAVVFLKSVLTLGPEDTSQWSDLVAPIAVGIFAFSILLIKRAH